MLPGGQVLGGHQQRVERGAAAAHPDPRVRHHQHLQSRYSRYIDIDIDISRTVSARWSGGPTASILASSLSSGATQVWAGQVTTRAVHMMPAPSLSAAWLRVSVSVPGWSWSCTVYTCQATPSHDR